MEVPDGSNDLPPYLNELIPFRCPKCGHKRRFATLRELRLHLQNDHSFQMGFIKPHVRANIFDNDSTVHSKKQLHKTLFGDAASARRSSVDLHNKDKETNTNNASTIRESSPLLETFKRETAQLELELEQAKQQEVKHKADSMKVLAGGKSVNEQKVSVAAIPREYTSPGNGVPATTSYKPATVHSMPDIHQTLGTLNREVMASRINHWATSDALYQSHELMQDMENAADRRCQEQKEIIRKLLSDIQVRDTQMQDTFTEQQKLQRDRHRLFDETEKLVREADEQNHELRAELQKRSNAIEMMNAELDNLKRASQSELMAKDSDLKNTMEKMKQLEWERDRLIQETEKIVRQADEDNQQLRKAILEKEEKISAVNDEMNKLRSDQQDMLEKTMSVYNKSEENKRLFKSALQAKEDELQEAMRKIAEMSGLQKQLMDESRILTDQADENTISMQRMLKMKEEQLKDVVKQLKQLKKDKQILEENTTSLVEHADSTKSAVVRLREMVKDKEAELKATQGELQDLKLFLKTAADKERIARQKLEVFIEDLLKRAETAEMELRAIRSHSKSHSTDLAGDTTKNNPALASTDTMAHVRADILEHGNGEESFEETERLRLPMTSKSNTSGDAGTINGQQNTSGKAGTKSWRNDLRMKSDNNMKQTDGAGATTVTFAPSLDTRDSRPHKSQSLQSFTKNATNGPNEVKRKHGIRNTGHREEQWITANNGAELGESFGFQYNVHNRAATGGEESSSSNDLTDNIVGLLNQPRRQPVGGRSSRSPDSKRTVSPLASAINASRYRNQYGDSQERDLYPDIAIRGRRYPNTSNPSLRHNRRTNPKGHLSKSYEERVYLSESDNSSVGSNAINEANFKSERTKDIIRQIQSNLRRRQKENRQPKPSNVSRKYERMYPNHQKSDRGHREDTSLQYENDFDRQGCSDYNDERKRKYNSAHSDRDSHKYRSTLARDGSGQRSRSDRSDRRVVHQRFDSRYPATHRSMVNLNDIPPDPSRDRYSRYERRERDRRSRSASAGRQKGSKATGSPVAKQRTSRSSKSTKKSAIEDDQSSNDKTASKVVSRAIEASLSEKEVAIDEVDTNSDFDKPSEDPLNKLMDDNGILWDDDNDTLPDVSDSELDRVSPSGSEAINRKTICPPQSATIPIKYGMTKAATNSSVRRTAGRNPGTNSRPLLSPRDFKGSLSSIKRVHLADKIRKGDGFRAAKSDIFVPIRETREYKSSVSDKDMTSGGREVYSFMKSSPSIAIEGSSITKTSDTSFPSSRTSHIKTGSINARREPDEKRTETRSKITDVCSPKRLAGDNGVSRPISALNMEEKIKSIHDKYKQRRQDIVEKKGFGSTEMYLQTDKFRTYSPRGRNLKVDAMNPNFHRSENNLSFANYPTGNTAVSSSDFRERLPHDQIGPQQGHGQHTQYPYPFPPGDPSQGYMFPQMIPYQYAHNGTATNQQNYPGAFPNNNFPYLFPHFMPPQQPIANQDNPEFCHTGKDNAINSKDTLQSKGGEKHDKYAAETPLNTNVETQERTGSDLKKDDNIKDNAIDLRECKTIVPTVSNEVQSGAIETNNSSFNYVKPVELDNQVTTPNANERTSPFYSEGPSSQSGPRIKDSYHDNLDKSVSPVRQIHEEVIDESLNSELLDISKEEREPAIRDLDRDTFDKSVTHHLDVQQIHEEVSFNSESLDNSQEERETAEDRFIEAPISEINPSYNEEIDDPAISHVPQEICDPDLDDVDSASVVESYGVFAEPIVDDSSLDLYSSVHSIGTLTDTDTDADTDSVRRDFYESSKKLKDLIQGSPSEGQKQGARKALSTTSSQASFDMLESIPKSRREEVRRRRQTLCCIFKFLDTSTLCRVASVCREWRLVTRSPKLWQRVELRNNQLTSRFLFHIARRCSQLKVLILEDLKPRNRKKTENLEEYNASIQCSLEAGYEHILKKSEATLHTIKVVNCGTLFSSKCLWIASCYSRMLKHVTFITDFDPITPEVMWALGSGCRELQTLDIKPIIPCQRQGNFTTRSLQLIGKCFRDLEVITVGGRDIDTSALAFIAKQCQKLKHVECYAMSLVAMTTVETMCQEGLKMLRTIHFNGTPVDPGATVTLYENCKPLESVTIHLSVNDYFQGTNETEDLKKYKNEVRRFDETIEKHPRLRSIVRLHVDRSVLVADDIKAEAPSEPETKSLWDRIWN